MTRDCWITKLNTLDKRIKSFAKGYRQNIALLGSDPDELSYLLDSYLEYNKLDELTCIQASTNSVGKQQFLKGMVFSLLNAYTGESDTLDNLINKAASSLPVTTKFIKFCLKRESISFLKQ